MIRLVEVTKRYGALRAVDRISLDVPAGKTVVLIGPSGCGKSTLLRLIAGLVLADAGSVHVADQPVRQETLAAVRDRLGYVIQEGGLFPHWSAERNVIATARFRGLSAEAARQRLDQLLKMTDFPADALSRYPAQLSGGQRQRVGLMRSLLTDPDVLLLDEPLGALDPMIRHHLRQQLRRIFTSLNKTVVLVTHDLHEADYFADLIVLMRGGRIEQQGTAADLVTKPATPFVRQFVQAQQMPDFGRAKLESEG